MDMFWWFLTTIVFFLILLALLGFYFMYYRLVISDQYIEAEKRLRLKLNEVGSMFKENSREAPGFVGKGINSLGLEGVIQSLIPPQYKMFAPIAVPILTGFANQILSDPAKMKALAERIGVKIPDGTQQTGFSSQM